MQFKPHAITNPYQKCPHPHGDKSAHYSHQMVDDSGNILKRKYKYRYI